MQTFLEPIGDSPKNKKLWPKFHQIRCFSEYTKSWKEYLDNINLDNNQVAYQHITLKYFEALL